MKILIIALLTASACLSQAQSVDFKDYDFRMADSVALATGDFDLRKLEVLTSKLTGPFTNDTDKFRAIYRWIAENISYDVDLYKRNKIKERLYRYDRKKLKDWNERFAALVEARLIKRKLAVCGGYAHLLETMCILSGIPCETIEGYGRTSSAQIGRGKINHAWNAVKLNNKWYLCDPTWSSGSVDEAQNIFYKEFNEDYFLADPDRFIVDHYPKHKSWTLKIDAPTLHQFLRAPIALSGFQKNQLVHISPTTGVIKGHYDSLQTFRFTTNLPEIRDVTVTIAGKFVTETTKRCYVEKKDDGYFEFQYRFCKKGSYRIYVYMRGKPTLVYEATVI